MPSLVKSATASTFPHSLTTWSRSGCDPEVKVIRSSFEPDILTIDVDSPREAVLGN
ncbi:MAG: hypothetical protein ACFFBD_11800 [Candidatus Hodarchaeota archaeon]